MAKQVFRIAQDGKIAEAEVSEEVYKAINKIVNREKYRARQSDECRATRRQIAYCEGCCPGCAFWRPKSLSVERREERSDLQMAAYGYADTELQLLAIETLISMADIDPDGYRIGWYVMHDYTQAEIAAILGIPLSTYRDRYNRILRMMREE